MKIKICIHCVAQQFTSYTKSLFFETLSGEKEENGLYTLYNTKSRFSTYTKIT